MWTPPFILADELLDAMPWIFVALILVAVGALAVWLVRKSMFAKDESEEAILFSLGNLRELVKSGKMSESEYATIRTMLAAQAKQNKKPSSPPPGGPLLR